MPEKWKCPHCLMSFEIGNPAHRVDDDTRVTSNAGNGTTFCTHRTRSGKVCGQAFWDRRQKDNRLPVIVGIAPEDLPEYAA